MAAVPVDRSALRLVADPTRLITKPYLPADQGPVVGPHTRLELVIRRVLSLTPEQVRVTGEQLRTRFEGRHPDLDAVVGRGFSAVADFVPDVGNVSAEVRWLIGAYFTHEYSIEGAVLTNPSIVVGPDQSGVPSDSVRVVVSLRAVGEGHVSSIEFRSGLVGPGGEISLDPAGTPVTGDRRSPLFDKEWFTAKLDEMGAIDGLVTEVLERLDASFSLGRLEEVLAGMIPEDGSWIAAMQVVQMMHWLASSSYELAFPAESELSQRVLFPNGPIESRGMEDARMVRFSRRDGTFRYYATYTAFDGFSILPQLIETSDFKTFRIATLNGLAAKNKGIAIFPRLVGGRYAALARSDGESNYFMLSDDIRFWRTATRIQIPARPWELMQIGNAGAPIETEAGWLVVTHGVGPMRQYALGAILLDLDDPTRVIGHLREPLLEPLPEERDGYVPNVVYSCGSIIHRDRLVIAYGASDTSSSFASLEVDALLTELTRR